MCSLILCRAPKITYFSRTLALDLHILNFHWSHVNAVKPWRSINVKLCSSTSSFSKHSLWYRWNILQLVAVCELNLAIRNKFRLPAVIIDFGFANPLIRSPCFQSPLSTRGIISQIYVIPNNFTDLKPKSEWFCDRSKSPMFLLLEEMKTLLMWLEEVTQSCICKPNAFDIFFGGKICRYKRKWNG